MIATYQRHLTGTYAGKAQKRLATHVWGPDIGSRLEARRDWQAAGGVGGLLMTLYPTPPAGSVISYEDWLAAQGVYQTSAIGSEIEGNWIPYEGSYSEPFYDENTGLWVEEYGGYETPYGFMTYSMASGYSWDYGYYEQAVLGHHLVHVPVMDHMGNVTSVVRLSATPGSGSGSISQREFLYDYDAFGKEQRASALIAGSNPDSYPFHYSTKFTDAETGLVYYGYRFYDPDRGRWINRDPIGEKGGSNLIRVLKNDLLNSLDRLGLDFHIIQVLDPNPTNDYTSNDISGAETAAQRTRENAKPFSKWDKEAAMDELSSAETKGKLGGSNKTSEDFRKDLEDQVRKKAKELADKRKEKGCCSPETKSRIAVGAHANGQTVATPNGEHNQEAWVAAMQTLKKEIEGKYPCVQFDSAACYSGSSGECETISPSSSRSFNNVYTPSTIYVGPVSGAPSR